MAIRPDILAQVFHDNQRDVQIGGQTDGITPEVAAGIGYTATPEQLEKIIAATNRGQLVLEATRPTVPENIRKLAQQHRAKAAKDVSERFIAHQRERYSGSDPNRAA